MIPQYNIKIVQDLDPKMLKMPSKSIIKSQGLIENEEYVNPTTYEWFDYSDVSFIELEAINQAKESAETIDDFFDIIDEAQGECNTLAEIGVSGAAIALVNAGYLKARNGKLSYQCIPITSSIGSKNLQPKGARDMADVPNIMGFATPAFGELLCELVKGRNIGLRNVVFTGDEGFALYAQNIEEMYNFGAFLADKYMNR